MDLNNSDKKLIEKLNRVGREIAIGFSVVFLDVALSVRTRRDAGYDPSDWSGTLYKDVAEPGLLHPDGTPRGEIEEIAKQFTLNFTTRLADALRDGLQYYDKKRVRRAIKAVIGRPRLTGIYLYDEAVEGSGRGFWDGVLEEGDLLSEVAQSAVRPYDVRGPNWGAFQLRSEDGRTASFSTKREAEEWADDYLPSGCYFTITSRATDTLYEYEKE